MIEIPLVEGNTKIGIDVFVEGVDVTGWSGTLWIGYPTPRAIAGYVSAGFDGELEAGVISFDFAEDDLTPGTYPAEAHLVDTEGRPMTLQDTVFAIAERIGS